MENKMLHLYKYTDKEYDELIKSMVIIVDTREKKNHHIIDWFDKKNILWKNKKLDYGDYSFMIPENKESGIFKDIYFDKKIVIEKKSGLNELSTNLTKERARFKEELTLAPSNKVLLIENANYSDVIEGNYDTQYNKKSYYASLHSFWHQFNLPIFFMPDSKYSGVFIKGYFEYYLRNYLR